MIENEWVKPFAPEPIPAHPQIPRPTLTMKEGFTTAVVEVKLNPGFGPLRCCNQFFKECTQHPRRILMAKDDDPEMQIEVNSVTDLCILATPLGDKLGISVEGMDSTAECIVLRLASALTGSDSFNLDFNYFD